MTTRKKTTTGTKRKVAGRKKTTTKKRTLLGVKGESKGRMRKNITKADLVKEIAGSTKLSQKDVQKVIDETTTRITNATRGGYNVTLAKFGSFKKREGKYKTKLNGKTYSGTYKITTFSASKTTAKKAAGKK